MDFVSEDYCRTGLKISAKSNSMALRINVIDTKLSVQGMDLE